MENFHQLKLEDAVYETRVTASFNKRKAYQPKNEKLVCSEIPGTVIEIFVMAGEKVQTGDQLLVLEAMKMNNLVVSHAAGCIKSVAVKPGDKLAKAAVMIEFV